MITDSLIIATHHWLIAKKIIIAAFRLCSCTIIGSLYLIYFNKGK